jgi:diaminopimelate epimerase
MPPEFIKFHGFGNDYIVIESSELADLPDAARLGDFARRICNRHYGAGADGIAVVGPSAVQGADFHVRIFNPDGSEASLSGNGTRCAAAYLYYKKLGTAEELRLSTRAGVKLYTLREQTGPTNDAGRTNAAALSEPPASAGGPTGGAGGMSTPADRKTSAGDPATPAVPVGRYVFDSELGQPKFDSASIPMTTREPLAKVIDYPLAVAGETFLVTALQMGNPNCCIFVDNFDALDWRRIGKAIETHEQFPDRTNVVFVRVVNRHTIELRIWERGVGETEASGTCSCAAAVAAMIKDQTERLVTVLMPGGTARIQWRESGDKDSGEVVITGSAEVIYAGDWLAGTG